MPAAAEQLISVESLVGADLQKIWTDPQFAAFCGRGFMAPESLQPGGLLFVGINPSYTEADKHLVYYNAHTGQHPYFRPFRLLAERTGRPWGHLDLLFHRETDQKAIDQQLQSPAGVDFVWHQLQLSRRLLDAARPAVIIVCNTKARELLGHNAKKDWLGLPFDWDEVLGTYRYQGIPTFFTSMLSGQRALDSGSFERLVWHVRRALKAT